MSDPETDKPLGAKDVQKLFHDLMSDPEFKLSFTASKNLLTLAGYFFRIHNDDGTFKEEFREKLAKFLHEDIWSHWMKYFFNTCGVYVDSLDQGEFGTGRVLTIFPGKEQRWRRQMETAYEDLEPQEKKSDQELADKLMKLLEEDLCK